MAGAATTADELPRRGRRLPRVTGEDRERAILETAERLLAERPLQEISVDDLARGAGISRPTFYFYFASKEAVVLALLDRLVEEARSGIELAMLASDPARVIRQGVSAVYETFRAHRPLVLAAIGLRQTSREARELWSRVMETFVAEAAEAITAERARGAALEGPPPRELAVALNLMNERVLQSMLEGQEPSIDGDGAVETLTTAWLRVIYGTDAPRAA
jgi:TetR/AcrR family transcriptional regulator, ethionamide resistance regulator